MEGQKGKHTQYFYLCENGVGNRTVCYVFALYQVLLPRRHEWVNNRGNWPQLASITMAKPTDNKRDDGTLQGWILKRYQDSRQGEDRLTIKSVLWEVALDRALPERAWRAQVGAVLISQEEPKCKHSKLW